MSVTPLKFLSEAKLEELRQDVARNAHRYTDLDFLDLERSNGWAIESSAVQVDLVALAGMDGSQRTAEADMENSLIVFRALRGMTPALACEERVWTRLTHIECLSYSRARWLAGLAGDDLSKAVLSHMFARGLTGTRDDNAISRLWWNMQIATIADPRDPEGALRLMLKRADIRMQFVERPGTAARRPLAQAILRAMRRMAPITANDEAFRSVMKALNREGGGVLFEALGDAEADEVLDRCAG